MQLLNVVYSRDPEVKSAVRLILDGYGASQYNYVTKTMFTDDGVNTEIYKSGVSVTSEDANNYAKYGLLRAAYGSSIFENAGKCAYVTDSMRSLLYGLHISFVGYVKYLHRML